jgi:hypothetical protein
MPAGKRIKLSIATGGDNLIMQISLDTKPFASLETDALVTYVFENGDLTQGRPAELDKLTGGMLSRLSKSGELTGKSLETTLLHAPAGFKAARLLLVGAGKREQLSPISKPTSTRPTRKMTNLSKLLQSRDSPTPKKPLVKRELPVAASSANPRISPATSSTSLPTSSPRASSPIKPKQWPRKPDSLSKSSMKTKSPI